MLTSILLTLCLNSIVYFRLLQQLRYKPILCLVMSGKENAIWVAALMASKDFKRPHYVNQSKGKKPIRVELYVENVVHNISVLGFRQNFRLIRSQFDHLFKIFSANL